MRLRGAALGVALLLAAPPWAPSAQAQLDSREAIALQTQLLQLRQEMEQLRGGGGRIAPPVAPPRGAGSGGNEVVGQLLDRVAGLEEEVRRQRGRADVLENQNRRLAADLEKPQQDTQFRFDQLEGRGGGSPRAGANAGGNSAATTPPPATGGRVPGGSGATNAVAPRTPERAIAEGRAALERRDFAASEAAAREVLAVRGSNQQAAAQLLLGDSLLGKRDFGNAAIAFNDAFTRARTGPRAPDAMIGLANAFAGLNSRREACDTLNELRSNFPNLAGGAAERASTARRNAGCR